MDFFATGHARAAAAKKGSFPPLAASYELSRRRPIYERAIRKFGRTVITKSHLVNQLYAARRWMRARLSENEKAILIRLQHHVDHETRVEAIEPPKRCYLAEMPAEIRNRIFEFAFDPVVLPPACACMRADCRAYGRNPYNFSSECIQRYWYDLLTSSRLFYDEVLPFLLYDKNSEAKEFTFRDDRGTSLLPYFLNTIERLHIFADPVEQDLSKRGATVGLQLNRLFQMTPCLYYLKISLRDILWVEPAYKNPVDYGHPLCEVLKQLAPYVSYMELDVLGCMTELALYDIEAYVRSCGTTFKAIHDFGPP